MEKNSQGQQALGGSFGEKKLPFRLLMSLLFLGSVFLLLSCAPPPGNVSGAALSGGPMGAKEFMFGTIQFIIMAFIVYYFLVISPARVRHEGQQKFLKELKKNDEVRTSGGIFARVVSVRPDSITLEIAPNVKIKVDPTHVQAAPPEKPAAQSEEKSAPKKN
jgi:preprotein translocase subunit YajC